MINKLKPKSEFSHNVLTLMTGTTIAQAIPIAISPILTRIYTPEDFGVFALFLAITGVFSVVASGRYELALMLPRKEEDAINIFALGMMIIVLLTGVLFLTVFLFHTYLVDILNNEEMLEKYKQQLQQLQQQMQQAQQNPQQMQQMQQQVDHSDERYLPVLAFQSGHQMM